MWEERHRDPENPPSHSLGSCSETRVYLHKRPRIWPLSSPDRAMAPPTTDPPLPELQSHPGRWTDKLGRCGISPRETRSSPGCHLLSSTDSWESPVYLGSLLQQSGPHLPIQGQFLLLFLINSFTVTFYSTL